MPVAMGMLERSVVAEAGAAAAAGARRRRALGLALIVGLGAWLRLAGVADAAFWMDEYGSSWTIAGGAAEAARRVREVHGQSPLWYWLLLAAQRLAGDSPLALRAPSIVAGVLLPLVGFAALRPWSRRAAAAGALLLAVHPTLVEHARTCRPYAVAELLAALALLGAARVGARGRPADRALAWSAAVLAAYTHYLFGVVLVVVALASLVGPRAGRRYGWRALLLDGSLAVVALLPAIEHVSALAARRGQLDWSSRPLGDAVLELAPRWPWVLVVAALGAGACAWRRGRLGAPPARLWPGLAADLLAAALPVGVAALSDVNLAVSRYLVVASLGLCLVLARLIGAAPAPVAALALLLAVWGSARPPEHPFHRWYGQVEREVDALEPGPDEPLLLWSGFVEANRLPAGDLTPRQRSFLEAPLAARPGRARPPGPIVPLTRSWRSSDPAFLAWLDREVGPVVDRAPALIVVAQVAYDERLAAWLHERTGGRLRPSWRSPPGDNPLVVTRWRRD